MIDTSTLARIWDLEERTSPDGTGSAVFSTDGTRRYLLTRRWAPLPLMAFVMLNPSRASEITTDATVTRCVRRAQRVMGIGGIAIVNEFSLIATDPRNLKAHPDPVGSADDLFIADACQAADIVVVAWGSHGVHRDRDLEVTSLLREAGIRPVCLGITATGQPRHPGRMSYSAMLRPYKIQRLS